MELMGKEEALAFVKLPWHDAKMLELRLFRDSIFDQDNLACSVEFEISRGSWRRAVVLIQDCTIVKIDLDLDGKKVCSDSIFKATCEIKSSFRRSREVGQLKNESNPLDDYYHFNIVLVSPGGELSIIAKGFEVAWED